MTPEHARRRALRDISPRLGRSWHYAEPTFAAALNYVHANPGLLNESTIIWHGGENDVYRLRLPDEVGGFDIVYKATEGMPKLSHAVRASTSLREAVNLRMLASLGFPCVDLLAVGENRTWRQWQSAFLVTRFGSGYQDGRHILPGFDHGDDSARRDRVIRACLACLARLHHFRLFHKAYKLYNILWRDTGTNAELKLIDVSSCKIVRFRAFLPCRLRDLADFFKPFDFSDAELTGWLECYRAAQPEAELPDTARLLEELRPVLAEAGFNWGQAKRNR